MELIIILTSDKDMALREAAKPGAEVYDNRDDNRDTIIVFRTASPEETEEHIRRRMEAGYADTLKVFSS